MLALLEFWLYGIALACMLFSSLRDIKTMEVPDFSSYFMIASGVGLRLLYSLSIWNFWAVLDGLLGLAFFSGVGLLMYYGGQWGGGDAKIMMGFGALAGLGLRSGLFPILSFIVMLVCGSLLGLAYSAYHYFKNFKKCNSQISSMLREKRNRILSAFSWTLSLILIMFSIFTGTLGFAVILASGLVLLLFYLSIWLAAVQEVSMVKMVSPEFLVEGDWLAEDLKIKGRVIVPKSRTGLEEREIRRIMRFYRRGKIRRVKVKYGMPFVPSFFLGLLVSLIFRSRILIISDFIRMLL